MAANSLTTVRTLRSIFRSSFASVLQDRQTPTRSNPPRNWRHLGQRATALTRRSVGTAAGIGDADVDLVPVLAKPLTL